VEVFFLPQFECPSFSNSAFYTFFMQTLISHRIFSNEDNSHRIFNEPISSSPNNPWTPLHLFYLFLISPIRFEFIATNLPFRHPYFLSFSNIIFQLKLPHFHHFHPAYPTNHLNPKTLGPIPINFFTPQYYSNFVLHRPQSFAFSCYP